MIYKNLLIENKNKLQYITINRPKQLNALNREVFTEIEKAFHDIYKNNEIKAVIITGSGDKAFVAGADIKEFAEFTPTEGSELSANGQRIFKIIEDCPKPVIAAINGFALGGGLELAMACHVRVAAENAKFGQPEVGLGVTPGYGGTQRLVQLIGKTKALELLITGDMIKANEALSLGLVNYVVSIEELIEKADEIASKIKEKSPMAIAAVLRCVNAYFKDGQDGFKKEVEEFGNCFSNEDFKEGTSAFIERRKPNFSGK